MIEGSGKYQSQCAMACARYWGGGMGPKKNRSRYQTIGMSDDEPRLLAMACWLVPIVFPLLPPQGEPYDKSFLLLLLLYLMTDEFLCPWFSVSWHKFIPDPPSTSRPDICCRRCCYCCRCFLLSLLPNNDVVNIDTQETKRYYYAKATVSHADNGLSRGDNNYWNTRFGGRLAAEKWILKYVKGNKIFTIFIRSF